MVDLETLHCGGDVVLCDVVRRRFGCVAVEDVLSKPSRKKTGEVVSVAGITARLASCHRNAGFGVHTWHVRRQVQVEELVGQRLPVRGANCGADSENFEGPGPVQR